MSLIPHRPIYLTMIRTTDIWLLLAIGALYELVCRVFLLRTKMKPTDLLQKEAKLQVLQAETDAKRKLGPSAFVETSKLERQVLALQKEVDELREARKGKSEKLEKTLLKSGNIRLSLLVWFLYYSVPILLMDDLEVEGVMGDYVPAKTFCKNLFFPISFSGLGFRVAKFGLAEADAAHGLGALIAMWSSQTLVGMLFDAVDAYVLCC